MKYCSVCGGKLRDDASFCSWCGHSIGSVPTAEQTVKKEIFTPAESRDSMKSESVSHNAAPEKNESAALPFMSPEELKRERKKDRKKKKHKLPFILRFLITVVIIAGVLLLAWYGFGNLITLRIHSDEVLGILNSGSIDLPGTENIYAEQPEYVKSLLNEETLSNENGPLVNAVLPYISAERVAVHGLFGNSEVEYAITAPDVESWLLNLDVTDISSTNDMLNALTAYLDTAPMRTVNVKVQYYRSSLFSIDWKGGYHTREFMDAVTGGVNSAYSTIYAEALKEIEGAIK